MANDIVAALLEMGIQPLQAQEAARRYGSAEGAVNWCFTDEGQNWKPAVAPPAPPRRTAPAQPARTQSRATLPADDTLPDYSTALAEGTTVEHREVADPCRASSPPEETIIKGPPDSVSLSDDPKVSAFDSLGSGSQPKSTSDLPSNNPFRTEPYALSAPPMQDDPEDDDLMQAIAMSKAGMEDDGRQERERSVRASGAPPPSPQAEEGEVMQTLFGPSEKEDPNNEMGLVVPYVGPQTTNEDEDLNRAIQDSLMTASFHSASAFKEIDKPLLEPRQEGAPVAFYSENGNSTYAANFVQAMYAVPQLREAIESVALTDRSRSLLGPLALLMDLYDLAGSTTNNYLEVDGVLKELRNGNEPSQLPPMYQTSLLHDIIKNLTGEALVAEASRIGTIDPNIQPVLSDPQRLFWSKIDAQAITETSIVNFVRNGSDNLAPNLYSHLAGILWKPETPGQSIEELGDILTVTLDWGMNAERVLWEIEPRIVLDRFLKSNAGYSAQIRAQQSVALGNVRRSKENMEYLTMFKTLSVVVRRKLRCGSLITHIESNAAVEDAILSESRREMKAKLQNALDVLKAKVADFADKLAEDEKAASGILFETDAPEMNQHAYLLRAVLFHDGALVAGKHLYMYLLGDDSQWYKVQDHLVTRVSFEEVQKDKTGLYMDGGPYMFVYSREGPRPVSERAELEKGADDLMEFSDEEKSEPVAEKSVDLDMEETVESSAAGQTIQDIVEVETEKADEEEEHEEKEKEMEKEMEKEKEKEEEKEKEDSVVPTEMSDVDVEMS
ncbi:hypothetical protein P7C73_g5163, partial [Tremellales sp. Uapishka_1]